MNPQDPLANLHPLREPLPVSWWPPAPGWWLLGALVLVALLLLAWYLIRRYRANAYRRRALAELARLGRLYRQQENELEFLACANALLKSVALIAYPRRQVAAISGEQWLAFLNARLGRDEQFPTEFVSGAYRATGPGIDASHVERCAAAWIRRHEAAR